MTSESLKIPNKRLKINGSSDLMIGQDKRSKIRQIENLSTISPTCYSIFLHPPIVTNCKNITPNRIRLQVLIDKLPYPWNRRTWHERRRCCWCACEEGWLERLEIKDHRRSTKIKDQCSPACTEERRASRASRCACMGYGIAVGVRLR